MTETVFSQERKRYSGIEKKPFMFPV